MRSVKNAAVAAAFVFMAACAGGSAASSRTPARIVLNTDSPRPTIDVVDVPSTQLTALYATDSPEQWRAILRVAVGPDRKTAVGQYAVVDEQRIRFTPMFPLVEGRRYEVTFTPPEGEPVTTAVALPPPDTTPTTSVVNVYPTSEEIPANQQSFHVEFSEPMAAGGAFDFIHLLDDAGRMVNHAFAPMTDDSWNAERTRYEVKFDDGGDNGAALIEGKTYTLVIDAEWRDAHRLPLKQAVRHSFAIVAPDERGIDAKAWQLTTPAVDTTEPLVVRFPESLDYESMLTALSVLAPNGRMLEGQVSIGDHERSWSFTPADPWKPGQHDVSVLPMLEDLAGNRIGEAVKIGFAIKGSGD